MLTFRRSPGRFSMVDHLGMHGLASGRRWLLVQIRVSAERLIGYLLIVCWVAIGPNSRFYSGWIDRSLVAW